MKRPIALVILDGFGYSTQTEFNACAPIYTPHIHQLWNRYPHAILKAAGTAVGLPENYIGNSLVGHTTIGAGSIIKQPVTLINDAIKKGTFFKHEPLSTFLEITKERGGQLHIVGILSDGGVHGTEKQLFAYIQAATLHGLPAVVVHPILDGRDTPPQSAATYLTKLDTVLTQNPSTRIGSLHGRFYAMDRDHNEKRTAESVRVLTEKQLTPRFHSWQAVLDYYYEQNITDEFIPPTSIASNTEIMPGDSILFTNIRAERTIQLIELLMKNKMVFKSCLCATAVPYKSSLKAVSLFQPERPKKTLKAVLSEHDIRIFTIAETEKYAHVTFFFDGGREAPFPHETRVHVPSLKVHDYHLHPKMSAGEITQKVIQEVEAGKQNFYLINYANADMVGHSGDFHAATIATQFLDAQIDALYRAIVIEKQGTLLITADHGNAEEMIDRITHQPKTAHTANPVPFIFVSNTIDSDKKIEVTQLADIAPFILKYMGLPVPASMSHGALP